MDPYAVLGVSRGASAEEIKKAYRRLALREHPDKGGDPERFKLINEAYSTLTEPQARRPQDTRRPFDEFDFFRSVFEGDDFFGGGAFGRRGGDPFGGSPFGAMPGFGGSPFGATPFGATPFGFGGGSPFDDDFFRGGFPSGGGVGTSISTTTVVTNGKRVTKTTKTTRHADGRVETTTEESGGDAFQPRLDSSQRFGRLSAW
mmetsp:Transcript_34307/g.110169  ORF Transcript_34307/g.110169 Transcript_34307/m.110169 type:complete len:202 (-) Transcript_34307:370-975(-)